MPREIEVKSILNKTKKRDSWFLDDYTVNLYSSCSFNCLYCYIRGSKYGENLATSISVKKNAIEVLDRQLFNRAKKEQYGFIVLSSATDPYLKIEKERIFNGIRDKKYTVQELIDLTEDLFGTDNQDDNVLFVYGWIC